MNEYTTLYFLLFIVYDRIFNQVYQKKTSVLSIRNQFENWWTCTLVQFFCVYKFRLSINDDSVKQLLLWGLFRFNTLPPSGRSKELQNVRQHTVTLYDCDKGNSWRHSHSPHTWNRCAFGNVRLEFSLSTHFVHNVGFSWRNRDRRLRVWRGHGNLLLPMSLWRQIRHYKSKWELTEIIWSAYLSVCQI